MNRQTVLRKIRACLRLAASNNPHEAAAALRQARALMDLHGITEADAGAPEFGHADVKTRARGADLTASISLLVRTVADAYACEPIVLRAMALWPNAGATTVRFHGTPAAAEVASYAFTVLRRQLDQARLKHISRVRKRANRERRGEEFALGWVAAVQALLPTIAASQEHSSALKRTVSTLHPDAVELNPREVGRTGRAKPDDYMHGIAAGREARLHHGVSGAEQLSLGDAAP